MINVAFVILLMLALFFTGTTIMQFIALLVKKKGEVSLWPFILACTCWALWAVIIS